MIIPGGEDPVVRADHLIYRHSYGMDEEGIVYGADRRPYTGDDKQKPADPDSDQ